MASNTPFDPAKDFAASDRDLHLPRLLRMAISLSEAVKRTGPEGKQTERRRTWPESRFTVPVASSDVPCAR